MIHSLVFPNILSNLDLGSEVHNGDILLNWEDQYKIDVDLEILFGISFCDNTEIIQLGWEEIYY